MQGKDLNDHLRRSLEILVESADELRDLDQALGDGDLGITITAGSDAVVAELGKLRRGRDPDGDRPHLREGVRQREPVHHGRAGRRCAAGRLPGVGRQGRDRARRGGRLRGPPPASSIAQRGKTEVGDKTILDGISAAAEALTSATRTDQARTAVVDAAARAVEETRGLQSRRGRASWLQERSIGLADPGATAFLRFVEAWARRRRALPLTGPGRARHAGLRGPVTTIPPPSSTEESEHLMNTWLDEVFDVPKPVIGMCHLPALPW